MNSPPPPPDADPAKPLQRNDQVGDFVIKQMIARGGTSIVYRAHDPRHNRQVAVKQLVLGEGGNDRSIQRAIREEAALHQRVCAADPKHLVSFVGVYEHARGLMLVSEFYPSTSLETLLQNIAGPVPDLRQGLGILAATAKGLQAIHAQGLIHRDLKPSNVLLGQGGGLKICDFGLAAVTQTRQTLSRGSARYLAPELLRRQPADGRADLYALGIIAYELLAGRPNFADAFQSVMGEKRQRQARWTKWHLDPREVAPPLSTYRSDLPDALVTLVARLMDKDPARRVTTAHATVQAIRRHLIAPGENADAHFDDMAAAASVGPAESARESRPAAAPDTEALAPLKRWPRRVAIALGVWLLVGGVGLALYQQHRAHQARAAREGARVALTAAEARYRNHDFAGARADYAAVRAAWPADTDIAATARAGLWRAEGSLAFAEGRYAQAVTLFERSRENGGDPAPLDAHIRDARHAEAFTDFARRIEEAIAQERPQDARRQIEDARRTDWADARSAQIDQFVSRINDLQTRAANARVMARAKALVNDGEHEEALAVLDEAPDLTAEGARYRTQIANAHQRAGHLADAQAAVAEADWDAALFALRAADALKPEAALKHRINQIDSLRLTDIGQAQVAAGNAPAGAASFAAALQRDPQNQVARRANDRITTAAQVARRLRQGDASARSGAFSEAAAHFTAALALKPADPVIQARLKQSRVAEALASARAATDRGDLLRARAALNRAAVLDPADGRVLTALAALDQTAAYVDLLRRGDAERDRTEYANARRLYLRARQLNPTHEVNERLNDIAYTQFIAQARGLMAQGEYEAAAAMLKQAARVRSTPELLRLMDEVDARRGNPSPVR